MQCQQLFVDSFNPITYRTCNNKVIKTCELCDKPSCEKCMFLVCSICKEKYACDACIDDNITYRCKEHQND